MTAKRPLLLWWPQPPNRSCQPCLSPRHHNWGQASLLSQHPVTQISRRVTLRHMYVSSYVCTLADVIQPLQEILRMSLSISTRPGSARQDCSPGLQPLGICLPWLFWRLFTSLSTNYSMSSHFSSWNTQKGAELLRAWLYYLWKSAASRWLTHSCPITLNTKPAQKVMLQFFVCSPGVTTAPHS